MPPSQDPDAAKATSTGSASSSAASSTAPTPKFSSFDLGAIKASLADAERSAQRTLLAQRMVMRDAAERGGGDERERGGQRDADSEKE